MISTIWDKVLRRTGIKSAINLYKVGKKVRSDQKIKIVFFCQLPHLWSCIESIYVEAEKDSEIEAYVLAIPNKWEDEVDTDAYDFCVQNKHNVIMAFDESKKTFFDLKSFNPDYVFIPRPYDVYLPEQYRGEVISNYTKVCYVCYGYAAEGGHILETCYNRAFTNNCYFLFPENDSTEEYCKKKHIFTSLFGLRKIVKTPFPRFDLLKKWEGVEPEHWKIKRDDVKKRIIWTPRWTTDDALGGTNFFNFKDFFLSYADKNKDCEFMFRPHPLTFPNFIKLGLMSEEEVDAFKARCHDGANISLDERKEYLDSFASADILVSDMSGVMIDFIATGKPLVFCSYQQEFNEANQRLLDAFYIPHNVNELEQILEMLIRGEDPKKSIREKVVKEVLGECDGKNGCRIISHIKADANKY